MRASARGGANGSLWAARAWLSGRWQANVLLQFDAHGHWSHITADVRSSPGDATVLPGPVLPGLVNAHSHAFQRAFAGLSERRLPGRDGKPDDFWSWRDRMYGVALRITPEQLQAVAAQLYVELLRGGYTQVCEFHYLHHAPDGHAYADPARLSWALADAAQDAGIGLTVLPVLYERAGFAQPALRGDQRRFRGTPASVHALYRAVQSAGRAHVNAGVAVHSLRAASPASIAELTRLVGDDDVPLHVHVAEQTGEVDDCLAHTGMRPIEWLTREVPLDPRWQLVHATHALPAEIDAVARRGAGIVICPSTEANLGDGLPDLPRWLAAGVPITVGSDSQVCRQWAEELRWLEYGQRLVRRQRNVAAADASDAFDTRAVVAAAAAAAAAGAASPSQAGRTGPSATAARLFDRTLQGGGAAAGLSLWGFVPGARADVLVLDANAPGIAGVPHSHTLDALVFATDAPAIRDVYVAGRRVLAGGAHPQQARIAAQFAEVMSALWSGTDP
ncbi:MAG: N-formylglutamate amidohydrolase [Methylibium sp. NZG]|nr:MAG: N-formylglutamate amidohydrolase [Methylibium sp. NZG]